MENEEENVDISVFLNEHAKLTRIFQTCKTQLQVWKRLYDKLPANKQFFIEEKCPALNNASELIAMLYYTTSYGATVFDERLASILEDELDPASVKTPLFIDDNKKASVVVENALSQPTLPAIEISPQVAVKSPSQHTQPMEPLPNDVEVQENSSSYLQMAQPPQSKSSSSSQSQQPPVRQPLKDNKSPSLSFSLESDSESLLPLDEGYAAQQERREMRNPRFQQRYGRRGNVFFN